MRVLGGVVAALAVTGCATAARYPAALDATGPIGAAAQAVDSARTAGADSLASDAMQSAQANLAVARDSERQGNRNRAAFKARVAQADATYAHAAAERAAAERRRAQEQAALGQANPGGNP